MNKKTITIVAIALSLLLIITVFFFLGKKDTSKTSLSASSSSAQKSSVSSEILLSSSSFSSFPTSSAKNPSSSSKTSNNQTSSANSSQNTSSIPSSSSIISSSSATVSSSITEESNSYVFVYNKRNMLLAKSNLASASAIKTSKQLGIQVDALKTPSDLPSPLLNPKGQIILINTTANTKFYFLDFEPNYSIKEQRENLLLAFIPDFPVKDFDLTTVSGFWVMYNS